MSHGLIHDFNTTFHQRKPKNYKFVNLFPYVPLILSFFIQFKTPYFTFKFLKIRNKMNPLLLLEAKIIRMEA